MTFGEDADNRLSTNPVSANGAPSAGMECPDRPRTRRQLLASAAVALSSITIAVAGVSAARAAAAEDPTAALPTPQPASTLDDPALWRRGEMLIDLRDWIVAQPGIKTSGYIESVNNPDVGSTILLWHGPANRMQRKIMDEAHRRGIPISVQQRKYTMNDLDRAADVLMEIDSGTGVFANFNVSAIGGLDIEFDGVIIVGEYIHPPAEGQAAADATLIQSLTALTGVATQIEHGQIVPL